MFIIIFLGSDNEASRRITRTGVHHDEKKHIWWRILNEMAVSKLVYELFWLICFLYVVPIDVYLKVFSALWIKQLEEHLISASHVQNRAGQNTIMIFWVASIQPRVIAKMLCRKMETGNDLHLCLTIYVSLAFDRKVIYRVPVLYCLKWHMISENIRYLGNWCSIVGWILTANIGWMLN